VLKNKKDKIARQIMIQLRTKPQRNQNLNVFSGGDFGQKFLPCWPIWIGWLHSEIDFNELYFTLTVNYNPQGV